MLLSEQIADLDPTLSPAEKADLLRRIDQEVSLLSMAREALRSDLAVAFEPTDGADGVTAIGNTVLIFKASSPQWKWDNPKVLRHVASALADIPTFDPETGEKFPPAEIARRIVEEFADLVGARTDSFSNWRTTKLKDLGIEPGAFREKKTTRYTLTTKEATDA